MAHLAKAVNMHITQTLAAGLAFKLLSLRNSIKAQGYLLESKHKGWNDQCSIVFWSSSANGIYLAFRASLSFVLSLVNAEHG